MFQRQEVGEAMVGEAAAADHLDLEAAEQLIQLSGGDGADDGGSESRTSADSVKWCGADQAAGMKEKEKEKEKEEGEEEVAVESRRRKRTDGRFGAGKESVVESRRRSSAVRFLTGGKNGAGVVDDREERRRRPRFRWLADVYRETRQQLPTRECWRAAGGPDPHPEADDRRKIKRKRAADAGEEVVVVPMVPKESKERAMVA